jgi:hypothetical protein
MLRSCRQVMDSYTSHITSFYSHGPHGRPAIQFRIRWPRWFGPRLHPGGSDPGGTPVTRTPWFERRWLVSGRLPIVGWT